MRFLGSRNFSFSFTRCVERSWLSWIYGYPSVATEEITYFLLRGIRTKYRVIKQIRLLLMSIYYRYLNVWRLTSKIKICQFEAYSFISWKKLFTNKQKRALVQETRTIDLSNEAQQLPNFFNKISRLNTAYKRLLIDWYILPANRRSIEFWNIRL